MKPIKLKDTVVHVQSQEEWDVVSAYYKYKWMDVGSYWKHYMNNTFINCNNLGFGDLHQIYLYKLISFKEWQQAVKQIPKLEELPNCCEIELRSGAVYYNLNPKRIMVVSGFDDFTWFPYSCFDANLKHDYVYTNNECDIMKITDPSGTVLYERSTVITKPEPPVTEITMEQIRDKFGVTVDGVLKIVDEG